MAETTAITAARFSITVDGYEIASFSELQGIRTEIKTVEFVESGDRGLVQMNLPSNPVLAELTLKRCADQRPPDVGVARGGPLRGDGCSPQELLARHVRALTPGKPVARYHLENAWPRKIELARCAPAARGADRDRHDRLRSPAAGGRVRAAAMSAVEDRPVAAVLGPGALTTTFSFTLPRGYVGRAASCTATVCMRPATRRRRDLASRRTRGSARTRRYLSVLLLTRTVTEAPVHCRRSTATSSRTCSHPTSRSCRTSTAGSTRTATAPAGRVPGVCAPVQRRPRR